MNNENEYIKFTIESKMDKIVSNFRNATII